MTKPEKKRLYAKAMACLRIAKRHRGKNQRRYQCWINRASELVERVAELDRRQQEPHHLQPKRKRLALAGLRLQRLQDLAAKVELGSYPAIYQEGVRR